MSNDDEQSEALSGEVSTASAGKRWFAVVPSEILSSRHVSDAAKLVYMAMLMIAKNQPICWASNETLAKASGKTPKSIENRHLRELEGAGWIRRRFSKDFAAYNRTNREIDLFVRYSATEGLITPQNALPAPPDEERMTLPQLGSTPPIDGDHTSQVWGGTLPQLGSTPPIDGHQLLEFENRSKTENSSHTTTTPAPLSHGGSGSAAAVVASEGFGFEEHIPSEEEEVIQEIIDLYVPEAMSASFAGSAKVWSGLWTPEQVTDALIDAVGKPDVRNLPRYVNGTLVRRKDELPRPPNHQERERHIARAEMWQGASPSEASFFGQPERIADISRASDKQLIGFMLGDNKTAKSLIEAIADHSSPWHSNLVIAIRRWRTGQLAQRSAELCKAYYSWLEDDSPHTNDVLEGEYEPDWPLIKKGLLYLASEFRPDPWVAGVRSPALAATFPSHWFLEAAKCLDPEITGVSEAEFIHHRLLWRWYDEVHPEEDIPKFPSLPTLDDHLKLIPLPPE